MAQMSRLKWDPIYSVHEEILDAQHQKLFAIVNNLIDVFESGSGGFLSIIHDLTKYLSFHFHEEHLVMMRVNYPGFLSHSKEHQKFTEKIEEFLQDYKKGDEDLGLNMVTFMRQWVRDHTTKMDMQYAEHLLKNAEKFEKLQK